MPTCQGPISCTRRPGSIVGTSVRLKYGESIARSLCAKERLPLTLTNVIMSLMPCKSICTMCPTSGPLHLHGLQETAAETCLTFVRELIHCRQQESLVGWDLPSP